MKISPNLIVLVGSLLTVGGARQAFCVNGLFFLAPQAILGGGKVGIRFVDFHFSTAHSNSSFWSFVFV